MDLANLQTFAAVAELASFSRAAQRLHLTQPAVSKRVSALETLKMLASVGLGWSVLPDTLVDGSLEVLRCPELALQRELGIVRHRARTLSNAARAMVEECEAHAGGAAIESR